MTQAMAFPKELNKKFFRDQDRTLMLVWALIFIIANTSVLYLQALPVRDLTEKEIANYTRAIFRIKVEKTAPLISEGESKQDSPVVNLQATQEDISETEVAEPMTIEEKRAEREARRNDRKAHAEDKRQQIARGIGIITGPTVSNERNASRGRSSVLTAIDMQKGGLGSIDLKNAIAIVSEAKTAEMVKKARGGGTVSGDIGDISLSVLKEHLADVNNLHSLLNESSLKISAEPSISGIKGRRSTVRSQKAISQVVMGNKNQVQYCYWTFKRKDPNLKGQVTIRFTINPAGEVTSVLFKESRWEGNLLRKDVEQSIRNVIMQWRFRPIKASKENVNASVTFIFE